jgi:hypothetical protein
MFDFRQPVRRHSIDIPLHDKFDADPDIYVLGGNNDILVTIGAGVQIAGFNHSSSSRQPLQKFPVSPIGVTAAQCVYAWSSAC